MNRREAINRATLLLGGSIIGANAFLSACKAGNGKAVNGILNTNDIALLNEVGETILPTTPGSPGAKAAKVGEFINIMVTDCYGPAEQKIFTDGIEKLKKACNEKYNKHFTALSPDDKHAFIKEIAVEAKNYETTKKPEDPYVHYFYLVKQLTVVGYFTSEQGATTAMRYEPIPGKWEPCISYKQGQKGWSLG